MNFYDPEFISNIHPALLFVIIVWIIVWKGLALWKAAHKEQPIWFVVLLVVNLIGILEILYLYVFSEMNSKKDKIEKIKSTSLMKAKSSKKKK